MLRSHISRRVVRAGSAAVIGLGLTLSGCVGPDASAGDSSGNQNGNASSKPTGKPKSNKSTTSAAPGSFDECGIVTVPEMAKSLRNKAIRVTDRRVRQVGKGLTTTCGYGSSRVGLALNVVEVTTEISPGSFRPMRHKGEPAPRPLHGLGDQAWLYIGPGPDRTREVRVQVLTGKTSLRVDYFAPADVKDPAVEASALARKAVDRLPDSPHVVLRTKKTECEKVDLGKVARALGEAPTTTRAIQDGGDGGDIACTFAGREALLSVSRWANLDLGAFLTDNRPNVKGIGDAARFATAQFGRGFEAIIRLGDRVLTVRATYARRHPTIDRGQPDAAERALLNSLAKSLGS